MTDVYVESKYRISLQLLDMCLLKLRRESFICVWYFNRKVFLSETKASFMKHLQQLESYHSERHKERPLHNVQRIFGYFDSCLTIMR